MAWSACLFNGGGALLAVACMVLMGLLVWLVIRLTAPGPGPAPTGVAGRGAPSQTGAPPATGELRQAGGVRPGHGPPGASASVGP